MKHIDNETKFLIVRKSLFLSVFKFENYSLSLLLTVSLLLCLSIRGWNHSVTMILSGLVGMIPFLIDFIENYRRLLLSLKSFDVEKSKSEKE